MRHTTNIIFALLITCGLNTFSQTKEVVIGDSLVFIRSISISNPIAVSIDLYDNLYAADVAGNISKFDSAGKLLLQYSPTRKGDVSALEARRNINIFVFNRNLQEYYFLDRFLAKSSSSRFSLDIGFARAATISADNNIWVIDDADFSLKKYGIHKQTFLLKTPLDLLLDPKAYQINYLTEYQNLLFVNDENSGILVFDNLGNFKNRMDLKGLKYFNFIGDKLYYLKDGELVLYNIYKSTIAASIPIPKPNCNFALIGENNRLYLFNGDSIDIYVIR